MSKSVAVLMGGWSAEREVSLVSGRECARALATLGYDIRSIDVTHDLPALVAALTVFQLLLARWRRGFAAGIIPGSERFFRLINELPTLAMIAIVLLVVLKPF